MTEVTNEVRVTVTYPPEKAKEICDSACFEFQLGGMRGTCHPKLEGDLEVNCPDEIREDVLSLLEAINDSVQRLQRKYSKLEVAEFNYGYAKLQFNLFSDLEAIVERVVCIESPEPIDSEGLRLLFAGIEEYTEIDSRTALTDANTTQPA